VKTAVVGSGGWGTALALVLLENGNEVTLVCRREEKCRAMAESRENPQLKGVRLPEELALTCEYDAVRDCNLVVLAVPSFAVRETARTLKACLTPGTVLVCVSKGIEKGTSLLLHQVVEQEVGEKFPVAVLTGPSHAEEVGRGIPTAVVVACEDKAAAELAQDLLMNERFRIYTSSDVIGVEVGGAMKNVIAICAGCSDGMGLGDNTKAMLMTRGLTEIARLGVALGAKAETFTGLAGVGDLIVTCTSEHSRNCRAGKEIGQGLSVADAVSGTNGSVVEGYYAAASANALAAKSGVEMPITEGAYEVLYEGKDPRIVLMELMTRKKRQEPEGEQSLI
jgi:glycerol-3-phosphate dehydrogenase (NAD(P)+)